jgi:hypothetical protein
MRLKVGSLLTSHYNLIDKTTGEKLYEVHYADDKKGIYHTHEFETRHKNIGIRMDVDDYVTFIKKANIELVGKNKFFKLLKKVINKFTK